MLAFVQSCSCSLNMYLVDRFGRRSLLIVSSAGSAFGMIILSLHHFYNSEHPVTFWIPVSGVVFTIFFLTFGISTVPFIMAIEILPIQVFKI